MLPPTPPSSFSGPLNQWQASGATGGTFHVHATWLAYGEQADLPVSPDDEADPYAEPPTVTLEPKVSEDAP